jgi:hypothetical protein
MDASTAIPEVDEESDSESEVEVQHRSAFREVVRRNETRPVVPRSKREQKLLANPQQQTIGTKKRPNINQLAVLKQSTLESMFSRQGIVQESKLEDGIFAALDAETEQFQIDIALLLRLIKGGTGLRNKQVMMLADMEIMNSAFTRFYLFLPEFHRRKKLQVEAPKLPYTICFTSRYR